MNKNHLYISSCCKAIVTEDMQQKLEMKVENADMEYKALQRLGVCIMLFVVYIL